MQTTAVLVGAAGVLLGLTGCGLGKLARPSAVAGPHIRGNVHGGAYPIQQANIRLMETSSTGVWGTNSYVGSATQLLTTTSDAQGSFSFPDGWSCDGGQYVYLQVDGGHTTSTTNPNVIQLAVVGSCTDKLATQAEIDNVNVFVSELSTVAAAYALNGFISLSSSSGATYANITSDDSNNDPNATCSGIGPSLTCTHAGLAHGFLNAFNLVDSVRYDGTFPTGQARLAIPGNPQSIVPQAEINTLGNILQSCVDSGGGTASSLKTYSLGSSACGDLFYYATPPGALTAPSTTLEAILDIANNPTNNVKQLFLLQPRSVFFSPGMSSYLLSTDTTQPMAYTLSVFYTGTGLPSDTGFSRPLELALDGFDNAYVVYSGNNGAPFGAVDELAFNGQGVFAGAPQTSLPNPGSIALDSLANIWLSNDARSNGNLFQISAGSSLGAPGTISQTLTVPGGYAAGVATDMNNSVWVSRDASSGQSLFRFNAGNAYTADTFTGTTALGAPTKRLVVDVAQNVLGITSDTDTAGNLIKSDAAKVWMFNYNVKSNAANLYPATLRTKNGYGLAMGNDGPYAPLSGQLETQTGSASSGYVVADGNGLYSGASASKKSYAQPMGTAMDGAGNLFWADFQSTGQVFKFVMTAAPSASAGTLTSFLPCLPINGICDNPSVANLRAMAIDSSGSLWYLSDAATGKVIQTLGAAAPSFPLLEYAGSGMTP